MDKKINYKMIMNILMITCTSIALKNSIIFDGEFLFIGCIDLLDCYKRCLEKYTIIGICVFVSEITEI